MRRRLDIAASIVTTPRLLFLDEPTTGLDPRSRNQVWDIVRALVGAGTTVLLTTQYLEEADQLADRIAIIDHGKVIAEGTSSELKASVGSGGLRGAPARPRAPAATPRRSSPARSAGRCTSRPIPPPSPRRRAPATPTGRSPRSPTPASSVGEFAYGQPSLDEVFLALTGHPAETDRQRDRGGNGVSTPTATMPETAIDEAAVRSAVAADLQADPVSPWSASLTFGWRAMLKIKHVPMQLFDVTVFPVMFVLLFTYLFGGALAGSTERVPPGAAAGDPRHDRRDDHDVHRHGPEHGSREGHLRPLPVDARVAPGGARRDAHGRRRPLHGGVDRRARPSASSSGSGPTAASSASRWPSGSLLVFCFACHGCGSCSASRRRRPRT